MHSCALRLPTSFTTLLQAAAARAWVRTASASVHNRSTEEGNLEQSNSEPSTSPASAVTNSTTTPLWERYENSVSSFYQHRNAITPQRATTRQPRLRREPSVASLHLDIVDDSHFQSVDPGRSHTDDPSDTVHTVQPWHENDPSVVGVPVGNHPLQTRPIPLIPVPTSPASLRRNLLYIISYRPTLPSLSALLDYHDLYPKLRSTRSYNLLIWLALRHCSFGSVQWLLGAMRADGLTGNLETRKLQVRWLIQAGSWDEAWHEVVHSSPGIKGDSSIPLPLWLEFFRTLKRGIRRTKKRRDWRNRSLLALDPTTVYSARYRALMANPPFPALHELQHTPPRAVYFVVLMMLRIQHSRAALSLTKSYFKSLPPKISAAWTRKCLDIIHLQITMGCSHRGLKKFYKVQRTMNTLVSLHPALRPTSTTLFHLLAPLRQAKQSGTMAWGLLHRFRSQWGARAEDRRVRRRVAGLAVKEGRMDIVNAMLSAERIWGRIYGNWKKAEQVLGRMSMGRPPRQLERLPANRLFKHNGREERHWHFLRRRIKGVIRARGQ
jgi:hypothetical protein